MNGCRGWFRHLPCFIWRVLHSLVFEWRSLRLVIWKRKSYYLLFRGGGISPNSTQKWESWNELFGDAICNVDGLPEKGQMFFSFLTLCKSWLKTFRSWAPFSVPNCRVNGQEYRWDPGHTGCLLLTRRFLRPESPMIKENDSYWQFLTESFLICLSSHWQAACVMLCCFVD